MLPFSSPPLLTSAFRSMGAPALAPGFRLDEYEILEVLGKGQDSIVYLARDHGLQRPVVLREYLPQALAGRAENGDIGLRAAEHADRFAQGLRAFTHEARLLACCEHPALVKVLRCWEARHTGYLAMSWHEGTSLLATRGAMSCPPDEVWLRALLQELLRALQVLHAAFGQHREITPANIRLQPDGRPVLLGFHAARRVLAHHEGTGEAGRAWAYAPLELYPESSHLQQGPWSDLYSLAAVMHFCVSGHAPPSAAERLAGEVAVPPLRAKEAISRAGRSCLSYRPDFLATLDRAFELQPQHRFHDAAEWLAALSGEIRGGGEKRGPSRACPEKDPGTQFPRAGDGAPPSRTAWQPHPSAPAASGRHEEMSACGPKPQEGGAGDPSEEAVREALAAALASVPSDRTGSTAEAHRAVRQEVVAASVPLLPRRWLWMAGSVLALMAAGATWQWGQQREAQALARAMAGASGELRAAESPGAGPLQSLSPPEGGELAARSGPPPAVESAASALPAVPEREALAARDAAQPSVDNKMEDLPENSRRPAQTAVLPQAEAETVPPARELTQSSRSPARRPVKARISSAQKKTARALFTSPRAACAPRQRFSLYRCMQTQCSKPAFRGHRQCRVLRERDEID